MHKCETALQFSLYLYLNTSRQVSRVNAFLRIHNRWTFAKILAFCIPLTFEHWRAFFSVVQKISGIFWIKYKLQSIILLMSLCSDQITQPIYIHLEQSRDPLPAFHLLRKRQLCQQMFDVLNRYNVGQTHTFFCFQQMLYE